MADVPHASFIPKETPGMTPSRVKRRQTFHVFGFIATIMLLGSIGMAGGVYFLKDTAQKRSEVANTALQQERGLFKKDDIAEVREFDRRVRGAEVLLKTHLSPLKILDALEKVTKQRIQFSELAYTYNPPEDVTLTLSGGTEEFKTLALQAIKFNDESLFSKLSFSEVSMSESSSKEEGVDTAPSISFGLTGIINPEALKRDQSEQKAPAPSTQSPVAEKKTELAPAATSTPVVVKKDVPINQKATQ